MKLVHPELQTQIEWGNQNYCEWIIESPDVFASLVQELYTQVEGEEGRFVLSDDSRELSLSKNLELVLNPLLINLNDKKIINKLYSDLMKQAYGEEMYLHTQTILAGMREYFYELEQRNDAILECDEEIDLMAVFKAIGVRIADDTENVLEKTSQYMKVVTELLHKRVIIFVGLKDYLTDDQMRQLYEMIQYQEMKVLFLESHQKDFSVGRKRYIIDRDGCEI